MGVQWRLRQALHRVRIQCPNTFRYSINSNAGRLKDHLDRLTGTRVGLRVGASVPRRVTVRVPNPILSGPCLNGSGKLIVTRTSKQNRQIIPTLNVSPADNHKVCPASLELHVWGLGRVIRAEITVSLHVRRDVWRSQPDATTILVSKLALSQVEKRYSSVTEGINL